MLLLALCLLALAAADITVTTHRRSDGRTSIHTHVPTIATEPQQCVTWV